MLPGTLDQAQPLFPRGIFNTFIEYSNCYEVVHPSEKRGVGGRKEKREEKQKSAGEGRRD